MRPWPDRVLVCARRPVRSARHSPSLHHVQHLVSHDATDAQPGPHIVAANRPYGTVDVGSGHLRCRRLDPQSPCNQLEPATDIFRVWLKRVLGLRINWYFGCHLLRGNRRHRAWEGAVVEHHLRRAFDRRLARRHHASALHARVLVAFAKIHVP
eukprot:4200440-Prymnesium_polylepis.2